MRAGGAIHLRRLALVAGIALGGLAAPATAPAQGSARADGRGSIASIAQQFLSTTSQGTSYAVLGGGSPTSQTQVPVRVSGGLFVAFHGDAGSGCALIGVCGYSGSISWRPASGGQLLILGYGRGRHRHFDMSLNLLNPTPTSIEPGGVTTAAVQLAGDPAAACTDAGSTGTSLQLRVHGGRAAFSLKQAYPALLATRCAGPRDGAVLAGLPAPTLPIGAVRRGRRTIDLTTDRAFSSSGFAGTVQSTIVIRLGAGHAVRGSPGQPVPGGRRRAIVVTYRASLGGSLVEEVAGAADPVVCGPLGACGVTGTETVRPGTGAVTGHLILTGPPRTTYRQLLVALGLRPGHPPAGVHASGFGSLGGGGTLAADITQGPATCRQTVPVGLGGLTMQTGRGHLVAAYGAFAVPGAGAAPTACPGPVGGATPFLATGQIPLRRLSARTITIPLGRGHGFQDDGYGVRVVSHLTLTLHRLRIQRTVSSAAVPGIL